MEIAPLRTWPAFTGHLASPLTQFAPRVPWELVDSLTGPPAGDGW